MEAIGQRSGFAHFGTIAATLLVLTAVGGLGAWVSAPAGCRSCSGLGHYLPERLGAVHPKLRLPARRAAVAGGGDFAGAAGRHLGLDHPRGLHPANRHDGGAQLRGVGLHLRLTPGVAAPRRRPQRGHRADSRWDVASCLVAVLGAASAAFATVVSMIPPRGERASGAVSRQGHRRLRAGVRHRLAGAVPGWARRRMLKSAQAMSPPAMSSKSPASVRSTARTPAA